AEQHAGHLQVGAGRRVDAGQLGADGGDLDVQRGGGGAPAAGGGVRAGTGEDLQLRKVAVGGAAAGAAEGAVGQGGGDLHEHGVGASGGDLEVAAVAARVVVAGVGRAEVGRVTRIGHHDGCSFVWLWEWRAALAVG